MRHIDHLVVAVRDLDEAARLYERFGFCVGQTNRHPWGTENRLIQFPESFIELIAVGQGTDIPPHSSRAFSFGAFVRDYLARREGFAMLALSTDDAKADAASFAMAHIGDFDAFHFSRRGRRPDGSDVEVAFTIAFAQDRHAPDAGFFVCQHHHPQNVWNAAFQDHANGAAAISAVVLVADDPLAHETFLEMFTGIAVGSPAGHDLSLMLASGRIDVVTPDDAAELYGSVEVEPHRVEYAAVSVRVPDLRSLAARLHESGVPYQHIGSRLVVPASVAHGVAIAFETA